MTEESESDYADESSFEEESESNNSVTTCEGGQKGKIFNEEMTGSNKSFTLPRHSHTRGMAFNNTCDQEKLAKLFSAPPVSPERGSSTHIPPQPPHPTLASKHIQTVTTRPSTSFSYTVVIDRSEQQCDEDQPDLLVSINAAWRTLNSMHTFSFYVMLEHVIIELQNRGTSQ